MQCFTDLLSLGDLDARLEPLKNILPFLSLLLLSGSSPLLIFPSLSFRLSLTKREVLRCKNTFLQEKAFVVNFCEDEI